MVINKFQRNIKDVQDSKIPENYKDIMTNEKILDLKTQNNIIYLYLQWHFLGPIPTDPWPKGSQLSLKSGDIIYKIFLQFDCVIYLNKRL